MRCRVRFSKSKLCLRYDSLGANKSVYIRMSRRTEEVLPVVEAVLAVKEAAPVEEANPVEKGAPVEEADPVEEAVPVVEAANRLSRKEVDYD